MSRGHVSRAALEAQRDNPLAQTVAEQRAHIVSLERRLALSEQRELAASREIDRLKREVATLRSAP